MFYSVYILYSHKDKRLYVGCTNNLDKRLERHEHGYVEATKSRRPLVLIYSEEFKDKGEAFTRERFLKTKWGNTFKQRVKTYYLKNIFGKKG